MYIFTKLNDKNNQYDLSDVELVVENNQITLDELMQEVRSFLLGSGWSEKLVNEYIKPQ